MTDEEVAYRNNEKEARLVLAQDARKEANVTSRTTSGQLLLIAGAILTFSSSVLSSSYTSHLSHVWKKLLVWSWVLFAASALLGIVSLFIDYYFFRRWHDYHFAIGLAIHDGSSPDKAAKDNASKKPQGTSSVLPLIAQSILIVIAAVLFITVISHALLST